MSTISRVALGAVLLSATVNAQAIPVPDDILCGVGTITEVLEGAWFFEGLHLKVEWEDAPPLGLPVGRPGVVRVLASDVEPEQLKVLRAAAWLAFANDFRVKLVSDADTPDGHVDCGRIREMQLIK